MFILVIFVIITMENTVSAADGGQLCLTSLFHRDKTKQGRGLGKSRRTSWKVLKKIECYLNPIGCTLEGSTVIGNIESCDNLTFT